MSRTKMLPLLVFVALAASTFGATTVLAQAAGTYYLSMTIPLEAGDEWGIGEIWHFPWSDEVDDEPGVGEADARLVFRDAAGALLYSRLVARSVLCNGDCHEVDGATVEIPAQAAARRAELYTIDALGNAVDLKATRVRSPNVPVVEILNPHAGQVLTDGLVIEWRGFDADGDRLEYDVLYRPSVGEWQQIPLAVLTTATSIVFERYDLPADDNATIAIAANDGFNTVETTVTGLKLEGNLPPELVVISPHDGAVYLEGVDVILMAYATDPEDGEIPVAWESDLDGPIAEEDWVPTSRGVHHLTISATDSGGLTVSEELTIYVGMERPVLVYLPLTVRDRGGGG